jgi:hypothetical protein
MVWHGPCWLAGRDLLQGAQAMGQQTQVVAL